MKKMTLSEIAKMVGVPVVELSTNAIEAAWKRGMISGAQASKLQVNFIHQADTLSLEVGSQPW